MCCVSIFMFVCICVIYMHFYWHVCISLACVWCCISHFDWKQKSFSKSMRREQFQFAHVKNDKPFLAPFNKRLDVISEIKIYSSETLHSNVLGKSRWENKEYILVAIQLPCLATLSVFSLFNQHSFQKCETNIQLTRIFGIKASCEGWAASGYLVQEIPLLLRRQ